MSGGVWISSMKSNADIGMKQGTRTKYFDEDWHPASLTKPPVSKKTLEAMNRSSRGHPLQRNDFPEAAAVWDEKRFKKVHDLFAIGGFYVVQRKLAQILARVDLGEGGLLPFTIYQADLETPYPGEFFLLNFGAIKNTILPEHSENVAKFAVDHQTGQQIWKVNSWHENDEVAVSSSALKGPDLWFEELVDNKLFLSQALTKALRDANLADDWRLKRCQVVGAAA